mmetsp:Transcript_5689/g.7955  ORF Transcript_5689/g.7955 Transcript_5689/m.7955 type:complete len:281 (+) Transcript_5689:54-896(+)
MSEQRGAIVTGGNTGIGLQTSKELAKKGFHVIIGVRSDDKGKAAVKEIQTASNNSKVEYILDLDDLQSVRKFADSFRSKNVALHVLINNAGIMALPYEKTKDGFERQFQVNHLGHFLLTLLLLDILKKSSPSRIINVSSRAHLRWQKPIEYEAFCTEYESNYDTWAAYGRSKLANILFTYELHRRLNSTNFSGVSVYALHPGLVDTQLLTNANATFGSTITAEEGAKTSIFLASADPAPTSGGYFFECKPTNSTEISYSLQEGKKLWDYSIQWTNAPSNY